MITDLSDITTPWLNVQGNKKRIILFSTVEDDYSRPHGNILYSSGSNSTRVDIQMLRITGLE